MAKILSLQGGVISPTMTYMEINAAANAAHSGRTYDAAIV
jgi:hypothetical protein